MPIVQIWTSTQSANGQLGICFMVNVWWQMGLLWLLPICQTKQTHATHKLRQSLDIKAKRL